MLVKIGYVGEQKYVDEMFEMQKFINIHFTNVLLFTNVPNFHQHWITGYLKYMFKTELMISSFINPKGQ